MNIRLRLTIFLSFFVTFNALAASDPVSWSLVPASGFSATKTGEQSVISYNLTNNLPFATRLVIDTSIKGGAFHIYDECHNKMINPAQTCSVIVSFSPSSATLSTFQLVYSYDKNRIALPVLHMTGVAKPSTSPLHGVIRGLPPAFYQNTTVDFEAIYTNTGTSTLTDCTYSNFKHSGVSIANLTTAAGVPPCTTTLKPGSSCRTNGMVASGNATGMLTINSTASCSSPQAVKVTPKASSLIKTPSGTCVVHASVDYPLPGSTYQYADNVVRFRFENECPTAITLGPVALTATSSRATITPAAYSASSTLNNCGATLAAGEQCVITASVIPKATGNLTITASATPSGHPVASAKTATKVASHQQSKHHILLINQCKFPVWYGIANGGNHNCPGTHCQTQDPNLATHPTGAPPSTYYLPAQVQGAAPSTIDLAVTSYQNGTIWPRTGCTMQNGQFNCATGTCQTKNNSATCLAPSDGGTGPVQPQSPFTKIEGYLTSIPGGDGVYDVSVINGMTVPVEMKAFGPSTGNTASTVYNCSAAGALIQPAVNNKLGNCTWRFNPESTMPISDINSDFYWVEPGADSGCANGINCGMSYNAYPQNNGNSPGPVNRREGDFLGYNPLLNNTAYTANAQWGSKNLFTLYGMDKQIAGQTANNNYGTTLVGGTNIVLPGNTYPAYNVLLSIPGITNNGSLNSCYQIDNSFFAHCGGCINWTNTLPAKPCGDGSPNYVAGMNFDWTTNPINAPVGNYTPFQAIAWLKNACPTAYSYQFDDQASSFQCNQDKGKKLLTSYQITFCPGGVDGLPAGATEGRSTAPN